MSEPSSDYGSDVDIVGAALAEIRAAAQTRRLTGEIPPDLEAQLDREFRELSGRISGPDRITSALDALRRFSFTVMDPPFTSRVPGGSAFHRLVSATVRRHRIEQERQLEAFRDAVADVLDAVHVELTEGLERADRRLRAQAAATAAQIAEYLRGRPVVEG